MVDVALNSLFEGEDSGCGLGHYGIATLTSQAKPSQAMLRLSACRERPEQSECNQGGSAVLPQPVQIAERQSSKSPECNFGSPSGLPSLRGWLGGSSAVGDTRQRVLGPLRRTSIADWFG